MAMIVDTTTYATPDGSYAVGYRVQFEPKTSLYEVNCLYMGNEAHRAYFDQSKPAVKYAHDWAFTHFMGRIVPEQPKRATQDDIFSLDDEPEAAPKSAVDKVYDHMRSKGLITDADIDAYVDSFGHLSADPAKCGCGDCLTYMAGEQ